MSSVSGIIWLCYLTGSSHGIGQLIGILYCRMASHGVVHAHLMKQIFCMSVGGKGKPCVLGLVEENWKV
jgi:hypothetical protein